MERRKKGMGGTGGEDMRRRKDGKEERRNEGRKECSIWKTHTYSGRKSVKDTHMYVCMYMYILHTIHIHITHIHKHICIYI